MISFTGFPATGWPSLSTNLNATVSPGSGMSNAKGGVPCPPRLPVRLGSKARYHRGLPARCNGRAVRPASEKRPSGVGVTSIERKSFKMPRPWVGGDDSDAGVELSRRTAADRYRPLSRNGGRQSHAR